VFHVDNNAVSVSIQLYGSCYETLISAVLTRSFRIIDGHNVAFCFCLDFTEYTVVDGNEDKFIFVDSHFFVNFIDCMAWPSIFYDPLSILFGADNVSNRK